MKTIQQVKSPKERLSKLSINKAESGLMRKFNESSNWKWGEFTLKHMDTNHIRSCIKQLQRNSEGNTHNHTKKEWLDAFKTELQYRNELADSFMFMKFPEFQKKFKQAVKNAIQE